MLDTCGNSRFLLSAHREPVEVDRGLPVQSAGSKLELPITVELLIILSYIVLMADCVGRVCV